MTFVSAEESHYWRLAFPAPYFSIAMRVTRRGLLRCDVTFLGAFMPATLPPRDASFIERRLITRLAR